MVTKIPMNHRLARGNRLGQAAWTAGLAFAVSMAAHGQSSDALLDKLVEKGVLSVHEANELKEETDKDFTKAFQVKTGMPDWVTGYRLGGDFRGRFEENGAENLLYHSRDRYRYRVRLGVTVSMLENFEVGLRLASGNPLFNPGGTLVGGSPITANQDLNSLESRKFIWIDQAYAKWTPIKTSDWTVTGTIGKMENPFQLSNMIFDSDINPEGGAVQVAYHINDKHTLKANAAAFVLDEINQSAPGAAAGTAPPSHDPYLYGGQMLLESKWTPKIETSIGLAIFNLGNKEDLSAKVQPFYNSGNTRDANGFLVHNYNPIIATGSITYFLDSFPLYDGKFPVKASGEYMNNPGAATANEAYRVGVSLGKAGKKKGWEINYRFQELQADSWFDAMVDDDNGAFYANGNPQLTGTGKANGWFGGTNVRGHLVQATYSFTDFVGISVTYYLNDLIVGVAGQSSSAHHFMIDLNWKL